MRTSTSSIPNRASCGLEFSRILFMMGSRLVVIISAWLSPAISALISEDMMSTARDAAWFSVLTVSRNSLGSTIRPLA